MMVFEFDYFTMSALPEMIANIYLTKQNTLYILLDSNLFNDKTGFTVQQL